MTSGSRRAATSAGSIWWPCKKSAATRPPQPRWSGVCRGRSASCCRPRQQRCEADGTVPEGGSRPAFSPDPKDEKEGQVRPLSCVLFAPATVTRSQCDGGGALRRCLVSATSACGPTRQPRPGHSRSWPRSHGTVSDSPFRRATTRLKGPVAAAQSDGSKTERLRYIAHAETTTVADPRSAPCRVLMGEGSTC